MRASSEPRRASSRRVESPFSMAFLGVLLLALELLLPTCSGICGEPPKFKTMRPEYEFITPIYELMPIEYVCNQGYELIVPSVKPTTICQPDGSYHPPLQEACTEMYCPKLQKPPNGKLVPENATYNFGAHVQYVCSEGYFIFGPEILICQDSGKGHLVWSHQPPSCEKIMCPPPPQISNGEFTNAKKTTYEYNDTVIYGCKPRGRYRLVGESKLVCIGYYQWSSPAPECKENSTSSNESSTRVDGLDDLIKIKMCQLCGDPHVFNYRQTGFVFFSDGGLIAVIVLALPGLQ